MRTLEEIIIYASTEYAGKNFPPASDSEAKHIAEYVRKWISSQGWYKMPDILPGGSEARKRTAARLWAMRQSLLIASEMDYDDPTPAYYANEINNQGCAVLLRRQAVQEVRDGIRKPGA